MKIHRFIGDYDFIQQEVEITEHETVKQIRNVLKLKVGEKIILSDGEGREAEVMLREILKNKIIGIIEKINHKEEAGRKVHLYLAILKKENFELAVQKAVEVGVAHIIPVITERTIKTGLNVERLEKIIREASEQSGRSVVPTLSPIADFADALEAGKNSEEKIIFHLVNTEYTPNKKADNVSIFIGPEGGFTEKEITMAQDAGYTTSSLGSSTLRGETAAIVATYRAVNAI
ncbi:MAG: RsmE family RNA methyltransferase [Candidatus Paceibacterota bacterium]|jgi:16S rRNA (uracil1498-N3)-methyltransferase